MKQIVLILIFLLFIIEGCDLSSQQEMALNKDLQSFIDSRNEGDALMYFGLTHPEVTRFYKNQGDAVVKSRFQQVPQDLKSVYGYYNTDDNVFLWERYFQQEVKKSGSELHVKFLIRGDFILEPNDSSFHVYGISTDSGNSWTFAEEQDYFKLVSNKLFEN